MTEERKWRFGTLKVELDAEKFGLDQGGWIELRSRLTAKDIKEMGAEGSVLDLLPGMMTNWSIKAAGDEVPFSREEAEILPFDIVMHVFEELQKQPFFARFNQEAQTTPTN